jgi:transcriptional regulator with XRE-family HTH domain
MSQTEFAESVGTSYGYLNMVINRRRTSISRQLALLIEEKYGYSADWLLHDEGDKKINHFKCNKNYERMKTEIDHLSSEEVSRLEKFILFIDELNKEEQEKRKLKKQFRGPA